MISNCVGAMREGMWWKITIHVKTLKAGNFLIINTRFLRNHENQWICCLSRCIYRRVMGSWADDKVKHQCSTLLYQQNMWQSLKSRDVLFRQNFLISRQSCLFLAFRAIAWVESWARPRFVSILAICLCSVDTTYTWAEPRPSLGPAWLAL